MDVAKAAQRQLAREARSKAIDARLQTYAAGESFDTPLHIMRDCGRAALAIAQQIAMAPGGVYDMQVLRLAQQRHGQPSETLADFAMRQAYDIDINSITEHRGE